MADLRFCAYQYQHLPLVALQQRWRDAERVGFDVLWNCDTVVEPDRARHMMFDGPATLTLMAAATTRIRVGTLVTSVYFRHPVTSAKAAMTLDGTVALRHPCARSGHDHSNARWSDGDGEVVEGFP